MRITLIGATGRMGLELKKIIAQDANLSIAGEISKNTQNIEHFFSNSDVAIDFSAPTGTMHCLPIAAKHKLPYVLGTTGFSAQEQTSIKSHAKDIAIVQSGNMSLGVTVLATLVQQAAKMLKGANFDICIEEMHHKQKKDAPSGTALLLGTHVLQGAPNTAIQYASLRGGTVVGEHSVILAGEGERIMLSHSAQDRHIFAIGAIKAAHWLHGRAAGLYNMQDVLTM
ncbi:dihydrodipicolinate reductase C-terminal domain-containing protein [Bartonella sp. TP]|uniref:4-hydroxy-tetrahydrodipicolinate reductase n=1 Tax=Bartonella sp. TP TaxID=3057550 RepID=UPI0025B17D56|nr:dihydrodipicolinate reductase C-terminal domain-containing protein [Bartonella sp. TP]MDN5249121.1 dihydrodipicolinate reductase C-terminal domain-containing protein [Alphaproteobacteria bacterium]WJW79671.1 dihydrodipicolinate reductase C-terminal domain-containing protein [Bartonella sp. TP]